MMATLKSEMKWKSLSHVRLSVIAWTICPWNSPGQNTGVSSHSFLQGIFPTQRSNPGLLYCRWILFSSWDTREAHFKKCCISNTLPYKMPIIRNHQIRSDQSLSRVRLFETPWIAAMPGPPVHHQLSEFTQTHVHQVSDAIQPSHPLSSPFPPPTNPSQHQSLFQWVNSSHEVAKVLEFQL